MKSTSNSDSKKICPVCIRQPREDEGVICEDCGAVHHDECWRCTKGCADLECLTKEIDLQVFETRWPLAVYWLYVNSLIVFSVVFSLAVLFALIKSLQPGSTGIWITIGNRYLVYALSGVVLQIYPKWLARERLGASVGDLDLSDHKIADAVVRRIYSEKSYGRIKTVLAIVVIKTASLLVLALWILCLFLYLAEGVLGSSLSLAIQEIMLILILSMISFSLIAHCVKESVRLVWFRERQETAHKLKMLDASELRLDQVEQ